MRVCLPYDRRHDRRQRSIIAAPRLGRLQPETANNVLEIYPGGRLLSHSWACNSTHWECLFLTDCLCVPGGLLMGESLCVITVR